MKHWIVRYKLRMGSTWSMRDEAVYFITAETVQEVRKILFEEYENIDSELFEGAFLRSDVEIEELPLSRGLNFSAYT